MKAVHDVHLTRDGVELRLTRRGTSRPRPVVLVAPGIFMHRGCAEHRLLAERLCEIVDVVTLDVRGHGDSGGAFSFGAKEPDDLAEVARGLRERHERVGGLGFSFGGYHTCVAAAEHRVFDAVALVGTPHRLFLLDHNFLTGGLLRSASVMLRRHRRLTRLTPLPFARRPTPSRLVSRIAPVPLLVAHGEDDWLVPARHAQVLYERAAAPKELRLIPGGLHAETMLAKDPDPLVDLLSEFFGRHLTL